MPAAATRSGASYTQKRLDKGSHRGSEVRGSYIEAPIQTLLQRGSYIRSSMRRGSYIEAPICWLLYRSPYAKAPKQMLVHRGSYTEAPIQRLQNTEVLGRDNWLPRKLLGKVTKGS